LDSKWKILKAHVWLKIICTIFLRDCFLQVLEPEPPSQPMPGAQTEAKAEASAKTEAHHRRLVGAFHWKNIKHKARY